MNNRSEIKQSDMSWPFGLELNFVINNMYPVSDVRRIVCQLINKW